ncbi:13281_t:CDS:1, partial [Racocetra persica]
ISAHKLPFSEIRSNRELFKEVLKGRRPNPFSEDTTEQYKTIVTQAWDQDPDKCPKINELRKQLACLRT